MKVAKKTLADRLLYLAASALFLFFLIYSAPHLVHHSFDESQSTPCLVFSLAKGCHLKPTSAIDLPITHVVIEKTALSIEVWISYFTPSPFPKRAPPVA